MDDSVWYPEGIIFEHREGVEDRVRTFGLCPDKQLFPYIKAYWVMTWDLPEGVQHPSLMVPSGCANLLISSPPRVTGPRHEVFHYTIAGRGRAIGVLFTIGGFYPYFCRPLTAITDGAILAGDAFGGRGVDLDARLAGALPEAHAGLLDRFFLDEHPARPYPEFSLIEQIAACIIHDEELLSTAQLVERFGISERKLQRLFAKFVGVSPKTLIRTKRFQTAKKAMKSKQVIDWADFALKLGYFDQAHFINDFRKLTGRTPAELKVAKV